MYVIKIYIIIRIEFTIEKTIDGGASLYVAAKTAPVDIRIKIWFLSEYHEKFQIIKWQLMLSTACGQSHPRCQTASHTVYAILP